MSIGAGDEAARRLLAGDHDERELGRVAGLLNDAPAMEMFAEILV